MMLILSALGAGGFVVLAVLGLSSGGTELERILAIACFFMAAAGFVGFATQDARKPRIPRPRASVMGDLFSAVAIAPVAMVCAGVFLLTLVPAIYVMLPVLAVWRLSFAPVTRERAPAPRRGTGMPAYA